MKEDGKARSVWLCILGYFLMGMLLLTILSRAADSIMPSCSHMKLQVA